MQLPVVPELRVREVVQAAETWGLSSPELAGAAALGAIALVASLWLVVRWIRRPMGSKLKRALSKREEVAILMHPNPDPDAMACAIGVAHLASGVGTDARLQFAGQIRHQENRAFRTVLDLELEQIDHVRELACEDVILVDHNTPRGFEGAERLEPYAVVDHHPGNGTGERFTDQRTDYGACATIVAEYLEDVGGTPVGPDDDGDVDGMTVPSEVSTGLLYGVQSDTKHLTSGCTGAEFEAAAYLYEGVDEDLLDRIANPQVSAEVLEVKSRAISGRDVRGSFAVSDVGRVNNADAVPQAADELLQLEGVTAVVVYGRRDETVHLSGRSRDDRVHMGKALETVADDIPGASAGGHARMGGGQVPVEGAAYANGGEAAMWSQAELADDVFAALNGDV
ncbi:bifunctional oligoribonuclease/PAP phosphatase NrnA [Halorussus gelatinilyticus]|uniref:Bifunctional oligoribonuclease/PAP phosphatase NrnA n=1 Tax=Halorussus gelatinilyticus TaxID=2937524 RepID=A0A8U0IF61_9EURY|nr:bifunctional oligoribonuclease/PAP phosphatase NrnA [Halorussus gelatinilyticus]UPV99340.1 bifunctional oligoribonuclease/PAP phosphatase NrnA [Halorussus gelatinilyticus]